jgi:PhoH-like ATPase
MVERNLRLAPHVTRVSISALPKLFVLDTNVLMHDPTSLYRFEEHDIFLPILTLEELDNNKKGVTEVARNARQASRYLDELVSAAAAISPGNIAAGIPLKPASGGAATGRLFLQTERRSRRAAAFSPAARPTTRYSGS